MREGGGRAALGSLLSVASHSAQSNWVMRSGKVGGRVVGVWLLRPIANPRGCLFLFYNLHDGLCCCIKRVSAKLMFLAGQSGKRPMG